MSFTLSNSGLSFVAWIKLSFDELSALFVLWQNRVCSLQENSISGWQMAQLTWILKCA